MQNFASRRVAETRPSYSKRVADQHHFFESGATRSYAFRVQMLARLHAVITQSEAAITEALHTDLGKPAYETFVGEIQQALFEIDFLRRHLGQWMQAQPVRTPLLYWPGKSYRLFEPKGTALVIAPWNYPFQLSINPIAGAIAAGNTAVLKPSELTPRTSALLAKLIRDHFPPEFLTVVEGGPVETQALLDENWDHIFFTGSTAVGKIIAYRAAEHLTPVTLELGGKSPVIVDGTVSLAKAARRIAWGKFFNAGQTCVAPDYVLVSEDRADALLEALKSSITDFFGADAQNSADYGRIVNARHVRRVAALLEGLNLYHGGKVDIDDRYIEPTLLKNPPLESAIMREEIFGPLLPVLTYKRRQDALDFIRSRPRPLALYVFTSDPSFRAAAIESIPFGGGCVNDTLLHLSIPNLPFGGTGAAGYGQYHGFHSFCAFSHEKGIFEHSLAVDPALRYPPYPRLSRWLRCLFNRTGH